MPRLTKRIVESAPPSVKPTYVWDDQLSGFGVKILPTGRRTYICKYRAGGGRAGRQRWFLIGIHGSITCDQAREIAVQVLSAVARGEDPQANRLGLRSAPTVADLWDRYEAEHLPRVKPSSASNAKQQARDHVLPALGRMKVAAVTRADVQALHRRLADRPYQANRVLALISKMMNLAELWGYRPDGSNPSRHIQKFPEEARERYLTRDELSRLGDVLREQESAGGQWPAFVAAVRLLLLTGARVSEILGAQWSWVRWDQRLLMLPDSKTGAKPLYLSDDALAVLRELREQPGSEANEYIIRGRLIGRPLVNLAKGWKVICQRVGLAGVRIHDLRHTAASIGVAQGLSLPILGRLLGHSQPQTTSRYAHVDVDPALTAANVIGKAVGEAMKSNNPSIARSLEGRLRNSKTPQARSKR